MLAPDQSLQDDRYQIVRFIAGGGQGAVYEARDLRLNIRVALKEALANNPRLRRAFEEEAQRLAQLDHPVIPNVIDHFTEGNGQYTVMQYIDGPDLEESLRQQGAPFSVEQVQEWADDLLDALMHMHEHGIIHRDIKPANLKLKRDEKITLLDFGLAKGGLTEEYDMKRRRSLYGFTLGYAPVEQMKAQPTNERSDLYGLGATLYTLLTNEVPANALWRKEAVDGGHPDLLRPANALNPQVPAAVADVLTRAMALDPNQRLANAAQMRQMLKQAFSSRSRGQIKKQPPHFVKPTEPDLRYHPPLRAAQNSLKPTESELTYDPSLERGTPNHPPQSSFKRTEPDLGYHSPSRASTAQSSLKPTEPELSYQKFSPYTDPAASNPPLPTTSSWAPALLMGGLLMAIMVVLVVVGLMVSRANNNDQSVTFMLECANGHTASVFPGQAITLSANEVVLIASNRPLTRWETSNGELLPLGGEQEFSYRPPSNAQLVTIGFTFAGNDGANESTITLPIEVVPNQEGFCYP